MKNGLSRLLFLGVASLCFACTSTLMETGRPIDPGHVSSLVKGKTTKEEVVGLFGEPQNKAVSSGTEVWTYSHMKATRERGAGSAALAVLGGGTLGAKDTTRAQTLTVQFKDNVVTDFTYSEGGENTQL